MLPYLSNRPPAFAFLTHYRDDRDLDRIGASAFLRRYSDGEDSFRQKMCSFPPIVCGEITVGFGPLRGEVVVVMRMPEEVVGPGGPQAVVDGLGVVLRRGAAVVGLGALTAPATAGGRRLLRHLPRGVTLTNANAYTAAVVRRNVEEAATVSGLGRRARVAVVGCTGSVGVATSHLLAGDGYDLVLVGRTEERVRRRLPELVGRARVAGRLDSVADSHVVVLLTADPTARLQPHHVARGTTVIDVAQPGNIDPAGHGAFHLRGAVVVEGGLVRIPGYRCTVDMGMPAADVTAACVAESYLFAREGIREHSVGWPAPELAERLERVAVRRGIHPHPLDLPQAANVRL